MGKPYLVFISLLFIMCNTFITDDMKTPWAEVLRKYIKLPTVWKEKLSRITKSQVVSLLVVYYSTSTYASYTSKRHCPDVYWFTHVLSHSLSVSVTWTLNTSVPACMAILIKMHAHTQTRTHPPFSSKTRTHAELFVPTQFLAIATPPLKKCACFWQAG